MLAAPEAAGEGFNGAARRGVASLPAAAAAVVIPTDLPLLETADLEAALPPPAALPEELVTLTDAEPTVVFVLP